MIVSEDGVSGCILGASPGASTSVHIMTNVIEKMFPEFIPNLNRIIPSYGKSLIDDEQTYNKVITFINNTLKLK